MSSWTIVFFDVQWWGINLLCPGIGANDWTITSGSCMEKRPKSSVHEQGEQHRQWTRWTASTIQDPMYIQRQNRIAAQMDYVLERYDVICIRGKDCQEHGRWCSFLQRIRWEVLAVIVVSPVLAHLSAGNRRLMELVETTVDEYIDAKSR